jgi:hypothetical protein
VRYKSSKIFFVVLKNLLAFFTGGVLSALATLLFAKPILEFAIKKDVGLSIVAIAPILILIYSVIFGIVGGLLGVIIYNLIKFSQKNKKEMLSTSEQAKIIEMRSKVAVLCPDNDSEAHTILKLADKAGISTIVSKQPHGAKLSLETNLESKLAQLKKQEIWIVETPGVEKENELRNKGINVRIIDHHTYGDLDRLTDFENNGTKLSSLEQFLAMAKIDDKEIQSWSLNPKTIRGIGIMDAKYVRGLREAKYSKEEMNLVLKLQQEIEKEIRPEFDKILKLAEKDWKNRIERNGYLIINSIHGGDIRHAISKISIIHNMDAVPMIINIKNGEKICVQNVDSKIVDKLKKGIKGKTYTFGSGRCWGVDNREQVEKVTLKDIFRILEK